MVITLLSDFGNDDNFVGIAKGILSAALPGITIIDLSHEVMPFHLLQCSYFLKSAFPYFPAGTVHLSLFDIMHRRPAALLLAEIEGQYVLSADNSLLPLTFPDQLQHTYDAGFGALSSWDWIKKTAAFLKDWESKAFSLDQLNSSEPLSGPLQLRPLVRDNSLECQVIHVDHYGNVIINLLREDFEAYRKNRAFRIDFSRNESIHKISEDYSSVAEGDKLCLFNHGGFLELSVNKGSAAQLFGLSVLREQQLIYQKIIIHFL
jgi:S-adenosylmethionine hydrolase